MLTCLSGMFKLLVIIRFRVHWGIRKIGKNSTHLLEYYKILRDLNHVTEKYYPPRVVQYNMDPNPSHMVHQYVLNPDTGHRVPTLSKRGLRILTRYMAQLHQLDYERNTSKDGMNRSGKEYRSE